MAKNESHLNLSKLFKTIDYTTICLTEKKKTTYWDRYE